jgi:hypothetical protein
MRNIAMFFFKACPKCKGDMYLDRDVYGAFRKCLQCGQIDDLLAPVAVVSQTKSQKLAA